MAGRQLRPEICKSLINNKDVIGTNSQLYVAREKMKNLRFLLLTWQCSLSIDRAEIKSQKIRIRNLS